MRESSPHTPAPNRFGLVRPARAIAVATALVVTVGLLSAVAREPVAVAAPAAKPIPRGFETGFGVGVGDRTGAGFSR